MSLILVVEDGEEYVQNLTRFLGDVFSFVRAGSGAEALEILSGGVVGTIFLDMCFDRTPRALLLGELDPLVDRFNGDRERAWQFLETNQGTYVLAAVREAGFRQPVIFSHDFDGAPRRFRHLERLYAPVSYLTDTASPEDIRAALAGALSREGDRDQIVRL